MTFNPRFMKAFLILFTLFISSNLLSQNITFKEFESHELGTTRTLKIYVPESYENDETHLYPLSIILDGDYLFDVYTGNSKLFAQKDKAPEQIIVGILQNQNKERYTDCSYDTLNGLLTEDSNKFYRFIRSELLDYLEETYRLAPFRTLAGSTLTANFINYFVIENEMVFDAFININPSYNTDMPAFLEQKLSGLRGQKLYYYLSSGNYNREKKHKRIEQVVYLLRSLENPDIVYKYDNLKNTTITASIGQAIPVALAHIFDIYSAISQDEFAINVKHLSPPDAIAYLENKYVEIEYLFGTNMKIRERDIFAIEPIVIDQENGDYLANLGEMIHKLYPKSPLSDYYIGMFYEKTGRYKQALKNYKNGYAKFDSDSDNAEAYYKNIERVLDRKDELIQEKEEEKDNRKDLKEQKELEKEVEKEQWKEKKIEEKENRKTNNQTKQKEWEQRKKAEKEMREKYRKKEG